MTIEEASNLVISSLRYQKAAKFLLDMGQPIKILDLAKNDSISGKKLKTQRQGDIALKIIGLRDGRNYMKSY